VSGLSKIGVIVEDDGIGPAEWGNALPILHQVRHALRKLRETGEPTLIDLRAMPFGPGDEERLVGLLGRGEVEARVEALGPTRIWETAYPGVWLVDHRNSQDERRALHIEVSTIPAILRSQDEDIADALIRLDACIASDSGAAYPSPTDV